MQYVDRGSSDLDDFRLRQLARPFFFVNIAANGCEGCDRRKLVEDVWRANVPCMNDVAGTAQGFDGFWS